ncbi:P pilus assembly chaperone PapD [Pedobacter cryoconitis]|uniref:P pilus assembly chaperone PapD n=1 Tax=Pedobacter cryoconitis TaxID=188932 RepID=A0A7W8ZR18_9SPHI|nr:molecular chaperone [Pedobacter cryoconitis]MBB5638643.1 P pilus assembly chaperone PapD [Pedobacter cryoconitis]MBB6274385.1 P pilus assembly chaperone PapD [Pedobacter cryoconitis]
MSKKQLPVQNFIVVFSLLLTYACWSPILANAQGNLLIMPRRVVFEGPKRTQELNLANTGKDTARYVVSVVEYRMKEDGNFEAITEPDPGQNFADKNFRFFPRNVVLAPNEAQVIKLQLTNTSQLTPGEYRSHLYFRAVPNEKPLGEKDTVKNNTSITVKLTAVFGIAIPIIIRNGESTTATSLSDLSLQTEDGNKPLLKMTLNRTGNMSVYGDIKVTYIDPNGKTTPVGVVNGVSVYTPNALRRFQLNLDAVPAINYRTGKLHIVYAAQADAKPEKFAEADLVLK